MTSIFISYSHKDGEFARYIAAQLTARGADVFIDYQRLKGGQDFMARLGREIEAREHFVILLSPSAVASEWVRAELSWALQNNKHLVPLLLDPDTSFTDVFFLAGKHYIDFTRWNGDGNVEAPLAELCDVLGLPSDPLRVEPAPPPEPPSELDDEADESAQPPVFPREDLRTLFFRALELEKSDPEQAIFLHKQVLALDPNFMGGRGQEFVARTEKRLKPARLRQMQSRAEQALAAGAWRRAARIAEDMLALDPENATAQHIKATTAGQNAECAPIYELACTAAERGNSREVIERLLIEVWSQCPNYGDPMKLAANRPISSILAPFVRTLKTLRGHTGWVRSVAWSPDGARLASGSDDETVRLWDATSGEQLAVLRGHTNYVLSVAWSPDGARLASGSYDGRVRLWDAARGEQLAVLRGHAGPVYSVAWSPDGARLASGSDDDTVRIWGLG